MFKIPVQYNETAACGTDLLQAAAYRRLVLCAKSSASGAHTWEMEARSAAKFWRVLASCLVSKTLPIEKCKGVRSGKNGSENHTLGLLIFLPLRQRRIFSA
jgi:hypothetical protein